MFFGFFSFIRLKGIIGILYFVYYRFGFFFSFEPLEVDEHDFLQQLILIKSLVFLNEPREHLNGVDVLFVMLQEGKNIVQPVVE